MVVINLIEIYRKVFNHAFISEWVFKIENTSVTVRTLSEHRYALHDPFQAHHQVTKVTPILV